MIKKKTNWIGELKLVIGQASPYLTIITTLMMAATFYHTTLSGWLYYFGFNLSLWVFLTVLGIGGLVFLWYERKYMLGGYYEVFNEQVWNNDNPMRKDMEQMQEDINEIKSILKNREEK